MTLVWEFSPYKGGSLLVQLALADHANDGGYCWPSVDALAKKCRLTSRQVRKILSTLEKKGDLVREMNAGHRGTNRYRIQAMPGHLTQGEKKTPCHPVPPTPVMGDREPLSPSSSESSLNHQRTINGDSLKSEEQKTGSADPLIECMGCRKSKRPGAFDSDGPSLCWQCKAVGRVAGAAEQGRLS